MHSFVEVEMPSISRKFKWAVVAGFVIMLLLIWIPCVHSVFAVRFVLGLKELASSTNIPNLPIHQTKLQRFHNGKAYEALLYYPENSKPKTAVVFIAGLSELGCYHPRAIALSRLLADQGFLVITPDIREFRDFQISAKPIEQILFWHRQIRGLKEGAAVNKTGLGGISFSGTIALMAAAQPEIRNTLGFVVAMGPYSNLLRCTKGWFAAAPESRRTYYPTRFYAKWIIMRSALDMLGKREEKLFLHSVLNNLLLHKNVPPPTAGLSSQAVRWYRLATMPETQTDPELTGEIEAYLLPRVYAELDPDKAIKELRCPVFLIHGAYDDLIPAEESLELSRKITGSHLLISPFLTHTHPSDTPMSYRRIFGAASDMFVFFYRFAQVVR
jgi:pimeloyl-ACP methyl ester carboxylesterase